jgi:hypothetical protein
LPIIDLASKKKQQHQIKKKLMEEFEKMGKHGVGIEELLKQLLDEVTSNRSRLAWMDESMCELKTVAAGSLKRIQAVEKKVEALPARPPLLPSGTYPPSSEKVATGKSPLRTEKMVDSMASGSNLRVETRKQGNGEGILGIPPRPVKIGVSHTAPTTSNIHTDLVFGKYFSSQDPVQLVSAYPSHKYLPKLDFPKFNCDNPKIWAKKCEVYFDVFFVLESLCTRYATLNFTNRAALWLETVEVSDRIEDWETPCPLVFKRWDRD